MKILTAIFYFLTYLLVLSLFSRSSSALVINEIMADPIADETLNEWIELYNDEDEEINVSNWIIGDGSGNDTIEGGLYNKEGAIIGAFGYAILTDDATRVYDNFNVSNDAVRLYVDDSSIGNGLSNDGETLHIYDNAHNPIDSKSYNKTAEGLSWAYINGTLMKSAPSPGFSNNGSILNDQSCDYAVDFILAKAIFDNSSDFSFQAIISNIKGQKTNFTSGGKIEDFNGKIMQEYRFFTEEEITTKRTSSKYSPNLEEGKSYILSSNLTVQCNDSNSENNFDIEIITIKGKPLENNSFLKIAQVYDLGNDEEAKFGDTIRIKLSAYKGNTNKESVSVWVEDEKNKISKESRTSLFSKYTNYSIVIPIQIKPNCDEKFDNGEYSIIAEGLGIKDEKEIEVSGLTPAMCDKKENNKDTTATKAKPFEFELMSFKEEIETGKEFKSEVLLSNNGPEKIPIKLWSYVYRGSKSYSGEREANKKEFELSPNSQQTIELRNIVENAEPGNYKFKVVINKNSQKTNNEITRDIAIIGSRDVAISSKIKNPENSMANKDIIKDRSDKITNNAALSNAIVYKSNTEKAKNFIPIFLIILSVIFNVILIWRR